MYEFCPLCIQKGLKRKTKAYQVTLDEAVWSCEEQGCIWPFGFEEPKYFQRVAGKTWSCYWDDCKLNISSAKHVIPISAELPPCFSSKSEYERYDLLEQTLNIQQAVDTLENNAKMENKCEKITNPCIGNMEQMSTYCRNISGQELHNPSKPCCVKTVKDVASASSKCHQEANKVNENVVNIMSFIKQSKKIQLNSKNKSCQLATPLKSTVSSICPKTLNSSTDDTSIGQCIPHLKKVCPNTQNQKDDSMKQGVSCQSNLSSLCQRKISNINYSTIGNEHCVHQPKKSCLNNQSQICTTAKQAVVCQNSISLQFDKKNCDCVKERITNNEHRIKQPKKICLNDQIENHDPSQQAILCETISFDLSTNTADSMVLNMSSSSALEMPNSKRLHCDTDKNVHKEYSNVKQDINERKVSNETNLDHHQTNSTSSQKKSSLNCTPVNSILVQEIVSSQNVKVESDNQSQVENEQHCQYGVNAFGTNSKSDQHTITTVNIEGLPPITLSYDASILDTLSVPETDISKSTKPAGLNVSAQPRLRSTQLSKRYSAESKKYKKFSFNAIMNKMKGQQANKLSNVNNIKPSNSSPSSILHVDTNLPLKHEHDENDLGIPTEQNAKEQIKSIVSVDISSIPNTSNVLSDNSMLSANISIDSLLDEFLHNNYSMSEEISDDWLNALLV